MLKQATQSLCPECFARLPARYVERGGTVHLERTCPEHGEHAPAVWADATHHAWAGELAHVPVRETGLNVVNQHACLAVVEVTTRCNLKCSTCFAGSGPQGEDLPTEDVHRLFDVVCEGGGPRPIQLSGGEPTVRDDLPALVRAARERGITHIEVNTNGIRLAEETGYAQALRESGVTAIYLQFDGLEASTHQALRGPDLTSTKQAALDACRQAGLPVILVTTVVKGVNDHELGDIVRFALANRDVVRSVNLQPVAHFGRYSADGGLLSLDVIARLLAEQLDFLEARDILPVPCCSAYCQAGTALLPNGEASAVPLTRFVDRSLWDQLANAVNEADWLELLAGTKDAKERSAYVASCCGIEVDEGFEDLLGAVMPLGLTGFMDADAADLERLQNCCVAVPTMEHGLVPFCAYNMTDTVGAYRLRNELGWGGRERTS